MKTILSKLLVIIFSLSFWACNDLLEKDPYSYINPEELEDSPKTAEQLIIGVYNTLSEGNFFQYGSFLYMTNMDCDYATGADWAFGSVGAGNPLDFWGKDNLWDGSYIMIHRANRAISFIEKMNSLAEREKKHAIGELSFLKAWAYFQLIRNYGPVPIHKASISDGSDPHQPRQSVKDVYAHIIELLKTAEGMYSVKDKEFVLGRLSSGAAKALLAKVYLTIASASLPSGERIEVKGGKAREPDGDDWKPVYTPQLLTITKKQVEGYSEFNSKEYFKLARDKALELINLKDYDLLSFENLWLIGNRNKVEHIWSLQAKSPDDVFGNTICQDYIGIFKSDGTIEGNWYGLSDHWFALFEPTDLRATDGVVHRWVSGIDSETKVLKYAYYPASYKSRVENKEAYNSQGNKYDGNEEYLKGKGWSVAKLTKFANVTDRKVVRSDFHFPFLRYAEVLLIFAEAENEYNNGPTADAYKWLNAVRIRSKASALSNLDKVRFRSAVVEERARELALEADRRYDLFRWGIYEQVMNAIDVDWHGILKRRSDRNLLYPIPQTEINANKMIDSNNKGW